MVRWRFAAAEKFLFADMLAIAKLAVSDYGRLRRHLGLAQYSAATFTGILLNAGFSAERLARNPGPMPHRLAFIATPLRGFTP